MPALAAGLLSVPTLAGTVTGTVSNKNTQKYLERASVQVPERGISALTEKDGSFRLTGLPAGSYTLVVSYTDLDAETRQVTVTDDGTVTADFELTSEVYKLDEFVVTSPLEGKAFGINQQRQAASLRSVTSVDTFIDQATGNPGEFLKNVEGIQMDYSQNEPQTIRVRGIDPNLTTVTMDGNEVASAASSSANRAVQIDQLSIGNIESVEVYKAPIPSMSANAIGGSVNLVTKSAFDQRGRRAFVQLGVNMDSHDFGFQRSPGPGHGDGAERRIYPAGRAQFSDVFLGGRLGVLVSIGHDHTNQLGSSTTHNLNVSALTGGTLPAAPIPYTLDNVTVRRGVFSMAPNRQLRVRSDASLSLDFKASDALTLFLKSSFYDYHSTNRNHGFTLTPGTLAAGATPTDYTTTNGTAGQGISVFDKYTQTWAFNPGAKFRSGDWKIELVGGFSKSTNHYKNPDNFTALSTTLTGLGWSMRAPLDTDVPDSITQTSGADFYDLNNYAPSQGNLVSTGGQHRANHNGVVSNNHRDSWDVKYSGRLDVQRDLRLKYPAYLKAGLAYNETIFNKRQEQKRWYWVGTDGIATADDNTAAGIQLGRFAEVVPVTMGIPGWSLREPTYFDSTRFFEYWKANPQVLQENTAYTAQQKIQGRQVVKETVNAGYAMGVITIAKLNVLAGLRLEQTDIRAEGYRVLPTSGANSVLPAGVDANSLTGVLLSNRHFVTSSKYTSDVFPYVHLRYELRPGLLARAAYTESIGRPNLGDVLPNNASINDTTQIISTNRAGLLPQRSKNWDATVEYYTKSAGQWTAGWFFRDIDGFISTVTLPVTQDLLDELGLGQEYLGYQITSKFNLGYAKWSGLELKFDQSLREFAFVPKVLHGASVWANYTKIYKQEGDFGSTGALITKLSNTVPEIFNAGVRYRTPGGKFYAHLSTNYYAPKPTANLPATAAAAQRGPQQDAYQFWNLELSYRWSSKVQFTCVGRNLRSERPTFSELGIVRNTQQATGVAWVLSTKIEL